MKNKFICLCLILIFPLKIWAEDDVVKEAPLKDVDVVVAMEKIIQEIAQKVYSLTGSRDVADGITGSGPFVESEGPYNRGHL